MATQTILQKHQLDEMEIDNMLSYSENKDHLDSLMPKRLEDLAAECKAQETEYMAEHFLSHYIMCGLEGKTVSEDVGEPIVSNGEFSLKQFISLFFYGVYASRLFTDCFCWIKPA
jgi:hypothetical protein